MKYEIKFSVSICMIDEKRQKHNELKIKLFEMERKMAEMTRQREVGLYALKLDRYRNLLQLSDTIPIQEQIAKEMAELKSYMINSRCNYNIIRYRALRDEYEALRTNLGDYHKAINIDLRNELKDKELPNIYIYQVNNAEETLKHIIIPNKQIIKLSDKYMDKTVIYPDYKIYSNREFRHFYNRISFKYLEQLSQDYSYELTHKCFKKVKIKKM